MQVPSQTGGSLEGWRTGRNWWQDPHRKWEGNTWGTRAGWYQDKVMPETLQVKQPDPVHLHARTCSQTLSRTIIRMKSCNLRLVLTVPLSPTGQATLWTKPELFDVPYTWKDVTCATPGSAGPWEDKGFPNDTAKALLITITTKLERCWAALLELWFLWKYNTTWQILPTGGTCPWRRRDIQRWRSHHHLESLPHVVQLHGSSMVCRS